MDADYGDIPLHSDIKWLNAGKCSQRFFVLRKEILQFPQTENLGQEFQRELQDTLASFKCPEFEITRQRAEYVSPSWSH
jgi:hypothetical protein